MELDKAIEKRRSVRDFKNKKVTWDLVIEMIDFSSKIPLAGNINNLKYIIVEDEKSKEKIAEHSQQPWISKAPVIVVVCSDESKLSNIYDERGKTYSRQQAGAAIQNFLLKATDLGISSCWVGAYSDEIIKQGLGIPGQINIEAIIPLGYHKGKSKPKAPHRTPLESLINWEKWGINRKPSRFKEADTEKHTVW